MVLPIFCLLVIGLIGCKQEEEIIPLVQEELIEEKPIVLDDLSDVIIGENGEIIGYFDKELNILDKDGMRVNTLAGDKSIGARDDISDSRFLWWSKVRLGVVGYSLPYFNGDRASRSMTSSLFRSRTSTFSAEELFGPVVDNGLGYDLVSLVIPPYMRVSFQNLPSTSLPVEQSYSFSSQPRYLDRVAVTSNTRISVTIRRGRDVGPNAFCGYAYEETNYGGNALPVFEDAELDLTETKFSQWNEASSSMSTNRHSTCSGLMLYEHAADISQDYHWVHPDSDETDFGELGYENGDKLDNKIQRIVEMPQVDHDRRRVRTDQAIGLITFYESDFERTPTYWYKGYSKEYIFVNRSFSSYVVAPGVTVKFRDETSGRIDRGPGYYNEYVNTSLIEINRSGNNDYCGELYHEKVLGDGEYISNERHVPIFKGLTNFTLNSGREVLKLTNVVSHWNNQGSTFIATRQEDTDCQGVTLWAEGGEFNTETGGRIWFPANTQQSFELPAFIDNKVSSISMEGCTTNSTGIAQSNADFVQTLFENSSSARSTDDGCLPPEEKEPEDILVCQRVRAGCEAREGVIKSGCFVGAKLFCGTQFAVAMAGPDLLRLYDAYSEEHNVAGFRGAISTAMTALFSSSIGENPVQLAGCMLGAGLYRGVEYLWDCEEIEAHCKCNPDRWKNPSFWLGEL